MPNTSSPTANLVTAEPTATTVPATSSPGTGFFGLRNPKPMTRIRYGPARHQVPGAPVQTRRVHPHQHLVVGDLGSGDPREAQDVGGAVAVLHDRPHRGVRAGPVASSWTSAGWCSDFMAGFLSDRRSRRSHLVESVPY